MILTYRVMYVMIITVLVMTAVHDLILLLLGKADSRVFERWTPLNIVA